ncbi:MAG TPA: dihydrofolate reductase family protein [Solirubrobacterales bacterium]|nr:dihydrofolate reductase family protein [Solirubrobacterales bacterium]
MGTVAVTEFISIDGVIQDPGGAGEYDRGGWSFEYDRGEEGDEFKLGELNAADAQLLGRITYEAFAAAWPTMEDEQGFAERMNSMPKYVVSTTITDPEWENTTVISGNVPEEVKKLKDQFDGDILIAGSAKLIQSLVEDDLVDEWRLMVFPTIIGEGKRLFEGGLPRRKLKLTGDRELGPDGIRLLTYERAD